MNRIFRHLPLYLFVLIVVMTINTINSTNTIGITNLIARTLFLDAFIPEFFYKDPIGVSSSISIEFWWSILIPIVIWIRRKKSVIIELILVTVVGLLNVGSQTIASSLIDYGKFNENRIWDFGIYFYAGNIAWEIFRRDLSKNLRIMWLVFTLLFVAILQTFSVSTVYKIIVVSFSFLVFGHSDKIESKIIKLIQI